MLLVVAECGGGMGTSVVVVQGKRLRAERRRTTKTVMLASGAKRRLRSWQGPAETPQWEEVGKVKSHQPICRDNAIILALLKSRPRPCGNGAEAAVWIRDVCG